MAKDIVEKWLEKAKKMSEPLSVIPSTYPNPRMDDPNAGRIKAAKDGHGDPVTIIQTITNNEMKKLTGEMPQSAPKIIRVNSPGLTTSPVLSFDRDDVRGGGAPEIRVIEGGQGIPDVKMFINPYTSTNALSHSSLLAPSASDTNKSPDNDMGSKGDSKGFSTTHNYDEMKKRMGNQTIKIDGETLDILLPIDTENWSGTNISIGGVPGTMSVKSKENGWFGEKKGKVKLSTPLHWDGNRD